MKKISACPSWLSLSDDRTSFVFLPERAKVVQKIFELCIGGLGSYAIANWLNRQNIPAFGRSPTWDHTTIDNMLRSKATLGEYQPRSFAGGSKKGVPNGDPIPNYYPAVINEATFQAAQQARKRNLVSGRGRKGENITNLFGGLTRCFYCGSPVKFHSNGDAKSLMCSRVIDGAGCIRAAWSYKDFESAVLQFLVHPTLSTAMPDETQLVTGRLAEKIKSLAATDDKYSVRSEILVDLKSLVSELRLACAGPTPVPTLPDAIVRRDDPKRFFEIAIRGGPRYKATIVS
jgi:Recombinase